MDSKSSENQPPSWDDASLLDNIACGIMVVSLPIFLILYFVLPAPYGKLLSQLSSSSSSEVWWHGPKFWAPLSWFVFESPNLVWSAYCWNHRRSEGLSSANYILYGFFTLHYIQRGIYYPLRMSFTQSKPVPLLVIVSAITFCSFNGFLQCRSLLYYQEFPEDWVTSWQFVAGIGLALTGASINVRCDAILRSLKKQSSIASSSSSGKNNSKSYYQIPRGFLFDYCSTPHFFGEILEWIGFAIACGGSLASVSFAIYAASNLIPRGVAQHAWYHSYFGSSYPKDRTAIIPYLF